MADELAEIPVEDLVLTIERGAHGSLIRLRDAQGLEPLRIEVGPDGPVLHIGSGLAIAVAGPLSLAGQRVSIHGRDGVSLTSGGDTVLDCEGDLRVEAREQLLVARLGDVELKANDDVKLAGERIRLNC